MRRVKLMGSRTDSIDLGAFAQAFDAFERATVKFIFEGIERALAHICRTGNFDLGQSSNFGQHACCSLT